LISRSCKVWLARLHPALGLRGRGVNELDAQPFRDAAELGAAVAALRLFRVDAENAVPIRIMGRRQAVRQHVRLQRLQISLGGLCRRKSQMGQPSAGVVDEHDQRAARAPALEPIVRAPVDLDEFAKARQAFANLKDLLGAPLPGPPQPEPNLDLPHRLLRYPDALNLTKLLARQRRAEIGVARHERRFDRSQPRRLEPVVRGPSASARHHPPCALAAAAANELLHLSNPDSQKLPSASLAQLSPHHTPHYVKPLPLRPAHRQNVPAQIRPLPLPQKGTSQPGSTGTFQLCCNTG
jgi:hypothetical protein